MLKCPDCGSTNIDVNADVKVLAFICYGCGKEWQPGEKRFSEILKGLSSEEMLQVMRKVLQPSTPASKTDEPRLITCRVCKKDVSSEAASCPHCGDPYITEEKKQAAEKAKKEAEARANYQMWKERGDCTNCGGFPSKTVERVGSTAFFVDYYCGTCGKFVRTETLYSYV